jgi:phosphoenolpyruvate carboxykinase (GTP)
VPGVDDLDLDGLEVPREDVAAALAVDVEEWRRELPAIRASFDELGERLPAALREQLAALEERLDA